MCEGKLAKCKLCGAIPEYWEKHEVYRCSNGLCEQSVVQFPEQAWQKLNKDNAAVVENAKLVIQKLYSQGYFSSGSFVASDDYNPERWAQQGWECPFLDVDICHEGFYDGRDDCCERCPMGLLAGAVLAPEANLSNGFSNTFVEWLAHGKRGASSNAIATKLSGVNCCSKHSSEKDYPHDPADLIRCVDLLKAVPEFKKRLHKMKEVSPIWAALVEHWVELEELLSNDLYVNRNEAPCTYRRMQELIAEAR